jgi:hypothetical protein
VRIAKSERALGVLEDKRFTKEGAEFREHSLRQYAARAAGVPRARARTACAYWVREGFSCAAAPHRFLRNKSCQVMPGLNAKLSGAPQPRAFVAAPPVAAPSSKSTDVPSRCSQAHSNALAVGVEASALTACTAHSM